MQTVRFFLRPTLATLLLLLLVVEEPRVAAQSLPDYRNRVTVKWAPLSMLDYYNTFLIGAEIPLPNPRFSIQQELGYGHANFSVWYAERNDQPDRSHFRSRSQVRFYVKEWPSVRMFVAAEHMLRRSKTVGMNYQKEQCPNPPDCDYYREVGYTAERIANAFHGKFGFQFLPSPRLTIDIYSGFGVKAIRSRPLTTGFLYEFDNDRRVWWEGNDVRFRDPDPSLTTGFQIGIRLGKMHKEAQ
jgi:hypothetical protein